MSDPRAIQMLAQGHSFFPGMAPPRQQMLDFQNIPGMGNQMGMMMSMALQPLIAQMTSSMGFAGLQFGGQQNLMDRYESQSFFLESRKAVQEASQRDQEHYTQRLLGMARLAGTTIGPEQIRAARSMSRDIGQMAATFGDMAPDFFDEMHGARGSASLMARRIHLGGRYMFDPYSGALGMSGETAGQMSSQIYENLYGADARLSDMRGIGAGRMGQMYDEFARRGLLGGGPTTQQEAFQQLARRNNAVSVREYAERISGGVGIDPQEFNADPDAATQRVMSSPQVRGQVIQAEAQRVSQRLKDMVGAVSAMRDIFGDMGKPNAPMVELLNGLQALTQGGMSTMSPGQLEMMVRRTQQLSRMSGITMEGMMQLMSRGAGLADQMGLDRSYAVHASQGAAAFGTAVASTGAGSVPGWRMPDRDTLTSLDQSLRLSGARSDLAQQFNATLRIADEILAPSARPGAPPRSQFEAMAQSVRAGRMTYQWQGAQHSVVTSFEDWRRMAAEAGVSEETAYALRSHSAANQEYGSRYNTGDLARLAQRDTDINPMLDISGQVAFRGIAGGDATRAAAFSSRAMEVLWGRDYAGNMVNGGMTAAQRADPRQRYEMMVAALRQTATAQGIQVSDAQLREASVRMWSDFEQRVNEFEGTRGYGGALGVFAAHDPMTLQQAQQNLGRANDRAQLHSALSGLGRTGILRNFMDELERTDGTVGLSDILGRVVAGGVQSGVLFDAMTELGNTYRAYQDLPDTPANAARRDQLRRSLAEITGRAQQAAQSSGFSVGGVGAEDVRRALVAGSNMTEFAGEPDRQRAAAGNYIQQSQNIARGLLFGDTDKIQHIGREGWNLVQASNSRWNELQTLASANGLTLEELTTGRGPGWANVRNPDALRAHVQGLVSADQTAMARIGELLAAPAQEGPPVDRVTRAEIERAQAEFTRQNDPQGMAAELMQLIGRGTDQAPAAITTALQSPAHRARTASLMSAYRDMQDQLEAFREEYGDVGSFDPTSRADQANIRAVIGDDAFSRVQPLLDALGSNLESLFPRAAGAGGRSEVTLAGPLVLTGRVSISDDGSEIEFDDVRSRAHSNPVEGNANA